MSVSTRSARLLIVLAAGSVISLTSVLPSLLHAQNAPAAQGAPGAAAAPAAAAKRPQPDMQAMSRAMRGLNTSVKDATKNTDSLDLVLQLQQESLSAKGAVPPMLAALPDAEKQAKMGDYRKEMNKLIRQELDLEEQLLSGDNAKATETLAALAATQAEGHAQFRGRGGRAGGAGRGPAVPGGTDAGGMRGTGANGGAPAAPANGQ